MEVVYGDSWWRVLMKDIDGGCWRRMLVEDIGGGRWWREKHFLEKKFQSLNLISILLTWIKKVEIERKNRILKKILKKNFYFFFKFFFFNFLFFLSISTFLIHVSNMLMRFKLWNFFFRKCFSPSTSSSNILLQHPPSISFIHNLYQHPPSTISVNYFHHLPPSTSSINNHNQQLPTTSSIKILHQHPPTTCSINIIPSISSIY